MNNKQQLINNDDPPWLDEAVFEDEDVIAKTDMKLRTMFESSVIDLKTTVCASLPCLVVSGLVSPKPQLVLASHTELPTRLEFLKSLYFLGAQEKSKKQMEAFNAELLKAESAGNASEQLYRTMSKLVSVCSDKQFLHDRNCFRTKENHTAWAQRRCELLARAADQLHELSTNDESRSTLDLDGVGGASASPDEDSGDPVSSLRVRPNLTGEIRMKTLEYIGATSKTKEMHIVEMQSSKTMVVAKKKEAKMRGVYVVMEVCSLQKSAKGMFVKRTDNAPEDKVKTPVLKKARIMEWDGKWSLTLHSRNDVIVFTVVREKPLQPDKIIGCATLRISDLSNFAEIHRDLHLVVPGGKPKLRKGRVLRIFGDFCYIGQLKLNQTFPDLDLYSKMDVHKGYAILAAAMARSYDPKRSKKVDDWVLASYAERYGVCESFAYTIRFAFAVEFMGLDAQSLWDILKIVKNVMPGAPIDTCASATEESIRITTLTLLRGNLCSALGELPDASSKTEWVEPLLTLCSIVRLPKNLFKTQIKLSSNRWFDRAIKREKKNLGMCSVDNTMTIDLFLCTTQSVQESLCEEIEMVWNMQDREMCGHALIEIISRVCIACEQAAYQDIQFGQAFDRCESIRDVLEAMINLGEEVKNIGSLIEIVPAANTCVENLETAIYKFVHRWFLFLEEEGESSLEQSQYYDDLKASFSAKDALGDSAINSLFKKMFAVTDVLAPFKANQQLVYELHAIICRLVEHYAEHARNECSADVRYVVKTSLEMQADRDSRYRGTSRSKASSEDKALIEAINSSAFDLCLDPPPSCVSLVSPKPHPDCAGFVMLFQHGPLILPRGGLTSSQWFHLSTLHELHLLLSKECTISNAGTTKHIICQVTDQIIGFTTRIIRMFVVGSAGGVVWKGLDSRYCISPISHLVSQLVSADLPTSTVNRVLKFAWRAVMEGCATVVTLKRYTDAAKENANMLMTKIVAPFCDATGDTLVDITQELSLISKLIDMNSWSTSDISKYFVSINTQTETINMQSAILQLLLRRKTDAVAQAFVKMNGFGWNKKKNTGEKDFFHMASVFDIDDGKNGTFVLTYFVALFTCDYVGDDDKDNRAEFLLENVKYLSQTHCTTAPSTTLVVVAEVATPPKWTLELDVIEGKELSRALEYSYVKIICGKSKISSREAPGTNPLWNHSTLLNYSKDGTAVLLRIKGILASGKKVVVGTAVLPPMSASKPPLSMWLPLGGALPGTGVRIRAAVKESGYSEVRAEVPSTFRFEMHSITEMETMWKVFAARLESMGKTDCVFQVPLTGERALQVEFGLPINQHLLKQWTCGEGDEKSPRRGIVYLFSSFICFRPHRNSNFNRIRLPLNMITTMERGGLLDSTIDIVTENEKLKFSGLLNTRDEIYNAVTQLIDNLQQ